MSHHNLINLEIYWNEYWPISKHVYKTLAELPGWRHMGVKAGTGRACATRSSCGRAKPMVVTTLCLRNHVQLPVSRSVRWMFDIVHITIVEICTAWLTTVHNNELLFRVYNIIDIIYVKHPHRLLCNIPNIKQTFQIFFYVQPFIMQWHAPPPPRNTYKMSAPCMRN